MPKGIAPTFNIRYHMFNINIDVNCLSLDDIIIGYSVGGILLTAM